MHVCKEFREQIADENLKDTIAKQFTTKKK